MHDLARQLDQVARRARRMLLTQRVCGVVAAVVGALAVLGPLDYWLRLPGAVRLVLGVGLLVLGVWRLGPGLVRAWRFAPPREGLARRLEQRVPALRGRLVSAMEFGLTPARFAPPHAAPVTAALAATAVQRTGADVDAAGVDRHLGALVNPVPTRRWLAAGLVALTVTAATLAAAPGPGFTALQRWFAPLSAAAWPARVALEAPPLPAVLPVDAPAGLRVGVTRGARQGLRVWAHHRFADGTGGAELMTAQPAPMAATAGDTSAAEDFRLNWEPPAAAVRALQTGSTEALKAQVWFTAGDGATAPQDVVWVARPRLVAASAQVRAPDYAAGRVPPQTPTLDPAGDTLSARAGSQVVLRLTFNKSLGGGVDSGVDGSDDGAAALLPALSAQRGAVIARPDARSAELTWTLRESVNATVQPVDHHSLGATAPPTLRFVAEPDAPPRVTWVAPEADRAVLATARLPVAAKAQDDLAVAWLTVSGARELAASASDDGQRDDPGAAAPAPPAQRFVLAQVTDPRVAVNATATLDLAARGAVPGDVFVLIAEAQDIYALDDQRHEPVRAPARRITVITPADLAEQLRGELAAVRRQAVRLEREQAALAQQSGADTSPARRAAEQGRLGTRLQAPAAQLNAVAQRIDMNGLDEPSLAALVADAASHAARAQDQGAAAAQTLATGRADAADAAQPQQEAARAALAELTALLDRGRDALGLKLELARLRTDQDRLAQDTRALLPRTVGRDAETLDDEVRAALDALADRQAELAAAAAAAVGGMQRAAESLATDTDAAAADPNTPPSAEELAASDRARAASQALAQAAAVAQRRGLTPGLQDSAQAVSDNRLAQAGSDQLEALDTLDAMLDQLGEEEALRQAILKRRQLELIDRLRRLVADQTSELEALTTATDAGQPLAPLAAAQSRLWVRTVAAETLARAAAEQPGGEAPPPDVAGHLVAAAAGQTQAQPALSAESAVDARAAEDSALSALQRALAAAQAAQDDATDQAARDERAALRKAYTEMAARQDDLQDRTAAAAPPPGEALPRRARAALRGLAAQETALRTEAAALAEQVDDTLVFKQTHARIDTAAAAAADALRAAQPRPDVAARKQGQVALLLRAMAAALEDPKKTQDFAQADSGAGGGGGGAGGPPPVVPPLAELLLLRSIQQAVYDETRGLHDAADAGPGAASRVAELGVEQRELAQLARQLIDQSSPQPPVPGVIERADPSP